MNPLKISITGVRGVVGETLTPHLIVQFTQAFATYVGGGAVFVCNDARHSAAMVRSAVLSGLLATGCEPVDFGVCPTPSMQFALMGANASAGIAVSAGHNPEAWNALRFIRGDGMYFNAQQGDSLLDVYHSAAYTKAAWDEFKTVRIKANPWDAHLEKIRNAFDTARIKKRKFHIAVDTCNGACSQPATRLLESMGCKVTAIHDQPGRPFPHDPEPTRQNMQTLRAVVRATGCDAGFMFDTAGDRLGIVTDKGDALFEELTLPLCVMLQMQENPGVVITNLSTTRAVEDVAHAAGARVIRTPIGQAYVAEAAYKNKAVIAGEGSGGIILPAVQNNNDSMATMAFLLHHMARRRAKISTLVDKIPHYEMCKHKAPMDFTRIYSAIQRARLDAARMFPGARLILDDGVKLEWRDAWLHLRPSNTESVIRIITEARTAARAEKLLQAGLELIA
jgi:phosphomannomutase